MTYVDLNPIRAGATKTPESFSYTSIQERIKLYKQSLSAKKTQSPKTTRNPQRNTLFPSIENYHFQQLSPFVGYRNQRKNTVSEIDFQQQDYFALLDGTGRAIRKDKRGAIPADILPIMRRLKVNEEQWVDMVIHFGRRFYRVIGPAKMITKIGV